MRNITQRNHRSFLIEVVLVQSDAQYECLHRYTWDLCRLRIVPLRVCGLILSATGVFSAADRHGRYDTGIITTSIAHQSFKDYMGNPNAAATGAIVATYIAGEAVGAITQSIFGDFLGRRRYMQLMCMVVTVGTIIQTSAQNYAMFLVGRILTGVAVGGLVGTVPIYNSEIAPPASRGLIGGLSGYMIGFGTFLALLADTHPLRHPFNGDSRWHFKSHLGSSSSLACKFFLPESPRWLINSGRDHEARVAFTQIRGDLSGSELHKEFDDMREQILFEKSTEVKTFAEAWSKYKKRILISVAVQSMTSLTGVNVVGYYQTTLYENLGITGQTILLLAGIYGTVGLIMNVFSIYFLDRFGRVKLLKWGTSALCVDLLYSALMTRYFAGSDNSAGKGFAVLGIYLFTAIYYLGLNSTTWLYGVEVLPVFLRSKVMGLAATSHFVWNVALTEAGPSAFANIGADFYYVFVATTFVAAVGIFVYFPETKGKTLEEIAASFGDGLVHSEGTSVGKVQDERLETV
ncbi:general substrate transporter [Armillaria mellea]|nr:general substrate transporter [Armillaria mellea]